MMIREISAMDFRKNFGELLNEVKYRHDSLLINKAGKPIAAIIDVELFEKIKRFRKLFDQLTRELEESYKGSSATVAESEIKEALKNSRKK